jgi:hypothetical protein
VLVIQVFWDLLGLLAPENGGTMIFHNVYSMAQHGTPDALNLKLFMNSKT